MKVLSDTKVNIQGKINIESNGFTAGDLEIYHKKSQTTDCDYPVNTKIIEYVLE